MRNRAVFLDRDGTLIVEKHYLSEPADVELLPGAVEALKLMKSAGFKLILVTNQSAIGRGIFDESRLGEIHAKFEMLLAEQDIMLDSIHYCPHLPTDNCDCRKPSSGMADKAQILHSIDFEKSFVVGDNLGDVGLGKNIGAKSILVRTGYGAKIESQAVADAHLVVDDVLTAAQNICATL